jgi:hypothetical protein
MSEPTSILQAAIEAHHERVKVWKDDAESRVEDISSEVTARLAKVLRMERRHPSLEDMIWVASTAHGQTSEDVLAEPMVNVALESELEGSPVRAIVNSDQVDPDGFSVAFEIDPRVGERPEWLGSDHRDWKPFESLAEMGALLV